MDDHRNFIVNPFAEAEAEAGAEMEMTNMQHHYDNNAWEVENEYYGYAMNDHVDEGQYETMYDENGQPYFYDSASQMASYDGVTWEAIAVACDY